MQLIHGDCLEVMRGMRTGSVNCCVTSPPYFGLRDYGVDGQIGLEPTPDEFVAALVEVFREVRRVLRDDGTLWLNLGDSYASNPASGGSKSSGLNAKRDADGGLAADNKSQGITPASKYRRPPGLKPKDLIGIPWRVAFALQADGWYLRQDIIWHKPNPMPESVRDRCTKAHEYIFLLSKSVRYYYDADAVKEPSVDPDRVRGDAIGHTQRKLADRPVDRKADQCFTRNRRSVWTVTTKPFKGAHFATFPPKLIEPCILAGCPVGGVVLDPFSGAGTSGLVALQHGREYIGIELNEEYLKMSEARIKHAQEQTKCQ